MPAVRRLTRPDLRMLVNMGDVEAAVELIQRTRVKTLRGLIRNVVEHEGKPVTPVLFDTCADAFHQYNEREAA